MIVMDFDFAYDICLLDDNLYSAQEFLNLLVSSAARTGLIVNSTKTNFVQQYNVDGLILCNGEPLERVESFVYFGSSIRLDGDVTEKVKSRIDKATGNSPNLKKILGTLHPAALKPKFIMLL
jgi:hypothetical protein